MTKRQKIYAKYGGRCAYCGKEIEFKDMQIDHIEPLRLGGSDAKKNKNPACRQCNHYKRANSLETFRRLIKTIHKRIREIYICKVAENYGIIKYQEWDGKFYFEKTIHDQKAEV